MAGCQPTLIRQCPCPPAQNCCCPTPCCCCPLPAVNPCQPCNNNNNTSNNAGCDSPCPCGGNSQSEYKSELQKCPRRPVHKTVWAANDCKAFVVPGNTSHCRKKPPCTASKKENCEAPPECKEKKKETCCKKCKKCCLGPEHKRKSGKCCAKQKKSQPAKVGTSTRECESMPIEHVSGVPNLTEVLPGSAGGKGEKAMECGENDMHWVPNGSEQGDCVVAKKTNNHQEVPNLSGLQYEQAGTGKKRRQHKATGVSSKQLADCEKRC